MCGQDQFETERLWRLHRPQPRTWHGRDDGCLRIDLFNRIGESHAGDGGAMGFRGGDGALN